MYLFNNKVKDGDAVDDITSGKIFLLYKTENGTQNINGNGKKHYDA